MNRKLFVFLFSGFVLSLAHSDEYGATALGVVQKMNLKNMNKEAEAKDLEERKQSAHVPRSYKVSPENPFYKHENNPNGQAPFFRSTDR